VTQDVSRTGYDPAYAEGSDTGASTTDVTKEKAADVAGSAAGAGQHVAGVAKEQAGNVAAETARQAKDVLGQARTELTQQAADQQQRVAGGLRSLGSELSSMAERSEQPGVATDLARQASTSVQDLADWLEQRDPGGLIDEVKTFARRRPGTFLAIALGAGLAAGRLTRGLKDESSSSSSPAAPTTPTGYTSPEPAYITTEPGYTPTGYTTTDPGYTEPSYPNRGYSATEGVPATGPTEGTLAGAEVVDSPPTYVDSPPTYPEERR
jgi:hypothetical protein